MLRSNPTQQLSPHTFFKLKIIGLFISLLFITSNLQGQCAPSGAVEYNPAVHGTSLMPTGNYIISTDLSISGAWTLNSGVHIYVDQNVDVTVSGNLQVRNAASLTVCDGGGVDATGGVNVMGPTGFPYYGTVRLGAGAYFNVRGSLTLDPESEFYVNNNSVVDVCATLTYHKANHMEYEGSGDGFYLITRATVAAPYDPWTASYFDPSSSNSLLWLHTSGSPHNAPKTTGQYCGDFASSSYCNGSSSTRADIWPGTELPGELQPGFAGCGTGGDYAISNREAGTSEPEIVIEGNGVEIVDGDLTPSTSDDTDFGTADITTETVVKTYTISNTGNADLVITGFILSSNSLFTVTQPSSFTISSGNSENFSVTFNPQAVGSETSSITMQTNDSDEVLYDFMVSGEGVVTPTAKSILVDNAGWHYVSFACDSIDIGDVSGIIQSKGYVQVYDESSISSDVISHSDDGWSIPDDLATTTVYKGDAVAIYTAGATTISYTCSDPVTDVAVNVINTCYDDENCSIDFEEVCPAQGWNLIGNPYNSTIDWDAFDLVGSDVANSVYLWDPENDRYASYVNGVGTNGGSRYIAPGQGFFVYSTTTNVDQVVFTDLVKSSENSSFFRLNQNMVLNLSLDGHTNTIIRISDLATMDFDMDFDAFELNNPSENDIITTRFGNILYSVNSIPDFEDEMTMNLAISCQEAGEHELSLPSTEGMNVFLIDNVMDVVHDMSEGVYVFNTTEGFNTSRFKLRIEKANEVTSVTSNSEEAFILAPNPVQDVVLISSNNIISEVTVYDTKGNSIINRIVDDRSLQLELTGFDKGIYSVNVITNGESTSKRIIKL